MAVSTRDIVLMAVSFFLVAILGPIALNEVFGANTTGWTTTVKTIFQTLLPILWLIGVAIKFVQEEDKN